MFSFGQVTSCWKQNQKIFWNDRAMAVWSHAIHRPGTHRPNVDPAYLNIVAAGVRSVFSWSGSFGKCITGLQSCKIWFFRKTFSFLCGQFMRNSSDDSTTNLNLDQLQKGQNKPNLPLWKELSSRIQLPQAHSEYVRERLYLKCNRRKNVCALIVADSCCSKNDFKVRRQTCRQQEKQDRTMKRFIDKVDDRARGLIQLTFAPIDDFVNGRRAPHLHTNWS